MVAVYRSDERGGRKGLHSEGASSDLEASPEDEKSDAGVASATAVPPAGWDLPTAEQPSITARRSVLVFDADDPEEEEEPPAPQPAARRTALFDAEEQGWT